MNAFCIYKIQSLRVLSINRDNACVIRSWTVQKAIANFLEYAVLLTQ